MVYVEAVDQDGNRVVEKVESEVSCLFIVSKLRCMGGCLQKSTPKKVLSKGKSSSDPGYPQISFH